MNVMQWAYLFILPTYGYSSSISMPLGSWMFLCVGRCEQPVTELFLVCTTGRLTQLNHQTRRPESLFQRFVQCRVIVSGEELAHDLYFRWWGKRETILNTHCHNEKDVCSKTGSGTKQTLTFHSLCKNKDRIRPFPRTTTFKKMGESKQNQTDVCLCTSLAP